jgi:predicted RNA-binding protein with PUA-like domain
MTPNHWLVKQEPDDYAWTDFTADKRSAWTGVRNYQARNHLRAMRHGDFVLYYHSGDEKQIVGLARVIREAYPDPTAKEGDWSAVDLAPVKPLTQSVSLATIRQDKALGSMALLRNSRLSVTPLTPAEFARLLDLAKTRV